VRGAPPAVERDVAKALAPLAGVSLLKIDGATIAARLRDVPWVASAGFDRSFPHTLTVTVRPERPVAVLRGGARAWLNRSVDLLVAALMFFMAWQVSIKAGRISSYGDATDVLRIVYGPFVYFSAAMVALAGLIHLYKATQR
jgi:hypothetical protein